MPLPGGLLAGLDALDVARGEPRPEPWNRDVRHLQQPDDPSALSRVGAEQFEHPGVVSAWLSGEGPGHQIWQVRVAQADRVRIAKGDATCLGCGPGTDAGDFPQPQGRSGRVEVRKTLDARLEAGDADNQLGSATLEIVIMSG